ncbi:hypothetical protein F8M41_020538 [Gigaspora margarita]|uniref:Zn(2)-C6 fungal-type domain-containing protein n=1 Tax=Gigaspora margarita TaxID=4874 RepID=A0A8H4AI57_GIGMA|nr:hypothetical protein F8M41_020538 [Gigaspora margarita]
MSSQERVYVSKACTNCQMRHEKCSPHVPCRNCVRHNFDCVFNYTYKKRGRKSKKRVDTNSSIQIQENIFSSSIDNQNQQLCNKMENTTQNHALISYDASEQSIISNDFNQEQFHPFNDITQKIDFLPQTHENSNSQNIISANYVTNNFDNIQPFPYDYASATLLFNDHLSYPSITESYNPDYNQYFYNLNSETYYYDNDYYGIDYYENDYYAIDYYDNVDSLTFNNNGGYKL